jgi:hypothetical protein
MCSTTVFTAREPLLPVDFILDPVAAPDSSTALSTLPASSVLAHVATLQASLHNTHTVVRGIASRHAAAHQPKPLPFGVGDYVLTASSMSARTRNKARCIWYGPAQIVAANNDRTFVVRDIGNDTVQTLHAQFLRRFADKTLTVTPDMRLIAATGGRGFLLESISSHRCLPPSKVWELLVHWEAGDETWEPLSHLLQDVPTMVHAYARALVISDPATGNALQVAISTLRA